MIKITRQPRDTPGSSVPRGASHPNLGQATASLPSGADKMVYKTILMLTLLMGRKRRYPGGVKP